MNPTDEVHMAQAIQLARRGLGLTWPNPSVGSLVVTQSGEILGRGSTAPGGRPHAETEALTRAGAAAGVFRARPVPRVRRRRRLGRQRLGVGVGAAAAGGAFSKKKKHKGERDENDHHGDNHDSECPPGTPPATPTQPPGCGP